MTDAPQYRPALLSGGQVPLGRALAFLALCQEVTQASIDAALEESEANAPEASGAVPGSHLHATVESHTDPSLPATALGPFTLFNAVVSGLDAENQPWAPRFASVLVWAESHGAPESTNTPAGFRAVTEASGAAFPIGPLAEAFPLFLTMSSALTAGLLQTPTDSASNSQSPTTSGTPG